MPDGAGSRSTGRSVGFEAMNPVMWWDDPLGSSSTTRQARFEGRQLTFETNILAAAVHLLRISAIVDACFRLIVDGESAPSMTRWGRAQVLV